MGKEATGIVLLYYYSIYIDHVIDFFYYLFDSNATVGR